MFTLTPQQTGAYSRFKEKELHPEMDAE